MRKSQRGKTMQKNRIDKQKESKNDTKQENKEKTNMKHNSTLIMLTSGMCCMDASKTERNF